MWVGQSTPIKNHMSILPNACWSNYPCICNVHILYTLYVKWQNWYSFSIDIHIFFILMKIIWIDASFHVFLDLHCILSFFWLCFLTKLSVYHKIWVSKCQIMIIIELLLNSTKILFTRNDQNNHQLIIQ